MSDNSEQHRHRCEVRFVLAMRQQSRSRAHDYLERVAARGRDVERLRADCAEQWKRGNRGEQGDWR